MQNLLRKIPQIDSLVSHSSFNNLGSKLIREIAKKHIDLLRKDILNGRVKDIEQNKLIDEILQTYYERLKPSLKPLINATGVILHTNMGRSPIDKEILDRASNIICNYSNLEYNQDLGKRGDRYNHASKLLSSLFGTDSALIVNNNASAVFLILNTFAKNKEVIVSRSELVEIGGNFRIPEVMKSSGAILCEVGTTNKTKITDYKDAINNQTAILMKVHRSNFTIEGFSSEVEYPQIKELAEDNGLIDYYDLGSGYIPTLPYNLGSKEPPISKILKSNPDLISFSGDKLFGSVQAGIIIGKKELIEKLKQNQLLRMLRVDKVTLSVLEETIRAYLEGRYDLIPALKMLMTDTKELKVRAQKMHEDIGIDKTEVLQTNTFIGGGTLPNREFPTIALHIKGKAADLERRFRQKDIIGRIERDMFLIDLRALEPKYDQLVIDRALEILP